jgi:hypothetical protein
VTVAADGSIWIADTAGDRVVGYTRNGRRIGVHDVRGRVVGIGDLTVGHRRIAILDIAAASPAVLTIDRTTGGSLKTVVLPPQLGLTAGLSGIAFDPEGRLILEYEGGSRTSPVDGPATRRAEPGRSVDGGRFAVEPGSPDQVRSSARVSYGTITFQVSVPQILGGVYLLGERDTSLDVIVDAKAQEADGTIRVDRSVRRYSADGQLLGSGRVPVARRQAYVAHDLGAAPDGTIVALVPRQDRFDIISVGLQATPRDVLPAPEAFMPAPTHPATARGCRDRRMMDWVFFEYLKNSRYLTAGNISGACPGRMKPRYLGGAGTYSSVAYDWGGWDTVTQWNSFMVNGSQACDIDTTSQACSKGVDCSGLVTRTWGLGSKYSTWSLPNISRVVALSSLVSYDIFNDPGNHVVHWHVWSGGGLMVSEATVSNRFDRVVQRWVDDTYVDGFSPRRFNNVC